VVVAGLAGSVAACGREPAPAPGAPGAAPGPVVDAAPPAVAKPSEALAAEISRLAPLQIAVYLGHPDASERRIAVRALGRVGGDDAAQQAATLLRDPDPGVREEACFAVGVTGSELAAGLLGPILESKPSAAEVAAAAAGLANCGDDAAGALLLRLALRDDLPVEAPEALFRHVRWRNRPWPGALPDDRLLRYETHPSARGRAGLGWMGRVWKDAKLVEPLERLLRDREPEVRRAAALGLGEGRAGETRPLSDANRAVAALTAAAADTDVRVVVSVCRALASYDREDAVKVVRDLLRHPSFLVRTAAAEGLGARKSEAALGDLAKAARRDESPSVRFAAATAVVAIDAVRARELVDDLLASPSDYVRSAGAGILAKAEDDAAVSRLVALAASDPHTRVRQAALDGLKGKKGPAVLGAVKSALGGSDPVLVAVAADVATTNEMKELLPDLRAAFARAEGTKGADAREGIVAALVAFGQPEDADLVHRTASSDPDAGPRSAAQAALAAKSDPTGKAPPPRPDRRPRPEGAKLPLDAPLLAHDVDLIVETDQGTMRIRLDVTNAPVHASHLADLARKGFYDGLAWHRVVPDFVVQGGCPRGDGSGNAGATLPLEPTRTPFERGTLGMPRSGHPDTGGCQLFICHSRAPHLDVQYSAIGRVVEGLDVIDRIDVGSKIVRVRVAEAL
jgi:cyclophilin family peptidyl-prolyl cis-trans isomerase/HEAT repeat protein